MTWIRTIDPADAEPSLKRTLKRVAGPDGHIDHILLAHTLRPHTLTGHMALYKNVLHHSGNSLEKWKLELLGVYVSLLNDCAYCVEHHFEGLVRLLGDRDLASRFRSRLESGDLDEFEEPLRSAVHYARALTKTPSSLDALMVEELRKAGLSDGEILEINQVVSYFAYANRTVLGLGVQLEEANIGLSPAGGDPDDWGHV